MLRPKAYVDLQSLGLTGGEEKSDSPFVSTLRPPSRTGPSMQVFQQASVSPDQAIPQTPVACTLDTDLPTDDHRPCTSPEQSGEGLLQCQPTYLRQRKYSQSVKDQREDVRGARLRPCPLRTTSLKARFPPEHSPWFVLPTNFAPVGGRARITPRGCGRVRDSSGRALEEYCYPPPSTELQTFAFVKIDLGSCDPLVLDNRLFHSLYIQAAGYKDCDVISER